MQIDYYYTLMSPWAYFGAPRFYALQKKYNFVINHFPLDIMKLFSISGGVPLGKRAEQRKVYRIMELKRWQKKLNMPINFSPKYFPPSDVSKASSIILSVEDQQKQNEISFLLLRQVWLEEKDIGDEKNIREACNNLNINFDQLRSVAATKIELYNSLAMKAAKCNVFGSPCYVLKEEAFWGQDRLDFLEEAIIKNI